MLRKTYAARGLLDFKMVLNVGGAMIRICFSGGYMGSNGVVAAKYTTDNPVIIHMIENSKQFAGNRIYLYKSEVINDKKEGNGNKEVPGKPNGETSGVSHPETDSKDIIYFKTTDNED